MQEPVERTLPCLLTSHVTSTIGIVELRAACALWTPREAILGGNLVFKHKVRTWGVLSKFRFWSECQFDPLLRAFKQRWDIVRWRLRDIAWHWGS